VTYMVSDVRVCAVIRSAIPSQEKCSARAVWSHSGCVGQIGRQNTLRMIIRKLKNVSSFPHHIVENGEYVSKLLSMSVHVLFRKVHVCITLQSDTAIHNRIIMHFLIVRHFKSVLDRLPY
jgi:hypothetical protein